MKGVILAGGKATRLRPLTWVTNKHLLPIYDKPMIFFPLEAMAKTGIKNVLIVTGPEHSGSFLNLLRDGEEFGLKLEYKIQEEAGGIAQAMGLAEEFAAEEKILVILGDNIFTHNLKRVVEDFEKQKEGAKIFAIPSPIASQYGVVEIKGNKVISIVEKPKKPKSNLAQIGIYMYDHRVFKFIKSLKPSGRGELEVTDLNNIYLQEGQLTCEIFNDWWVDAGTSIDELLRANILVAQQLNQEKDPKWNLQHFLSPKI